MAVKKREAKSEGGKERYTYLNAEFQKQQGEIRKPSSVINAKIEENNRMGKTTDLFKKIRDTKGMSHEKMDSIKDRNGRDLTEAEDIKKRWQEHRRTVQKRSS